MSYSMMMTSHNTQQQLNLLSTTNLIYVILIVDPQIAFSYPIIYKVIELMIVCNV